MLLLFQISFTIFMNFCDLFHYFENSRKFMEIHGNSLKIKKGPFRSGSNTKKSLHS